MSRKLLLIIIGIIVVGGLLYGYVATRTPSSTTDTTTKTGLGSLFPFTGGGTQATPTTGTSDPSTTGNSPTGQATTTPATPSNLKKISSRSIAGFTILAAGSVPTRIQHGASDTASSTPSTYSVAAIRYAEAGTGYIYSSDASGANENKVSDTLIARTLQAVFANNGNNVAVRYIKEDNKTVATFVGAINDPAEGATVGSIKGAFFPDNIIDMVASPDQKSFFYVAKTATGSVGMTIAVDGTNKKQLFTSPMSEWLTGWTRGGQTVTAKAASDIPGYAYTVTANGALSKIVGNVNGLTTNISPDGKMMLYSLAEKGGLYLYAKSLTTNVASDLNLGTLPEKCVWSKDDVTAYCAAPSTLPQGTYPDDWYQGSIHFNDTLYRINTLTGTSTILASDEGNNIDGVHLALDTDEHYLLFINQSDNSLWSLNLAP